MAQLKYTSCLVPIYPNLFSIGTYNYNISLRFHDVHAPSSYLAKNSFPFINSVIQADKVLISFAKINLFTNILLTETNYMPII